MDKLERPHVAEQPGRRRHLPVDGHTWWCEIRPWLATSISSNPMCRWAEREQPDRLAVRQRCGWSTPTSKDCHRAEVRRGVARRVDLSGPASYVPDGVEDEVDEPERALHPCGRHIADAESGSRRRLPWPEGLQIIARDNSMPWTSRRAGAAAGRSARCRSRTRAPAPSSANAARALPGADGSGRVHSVVGVVVVGGVSLPK